MLCGSGLKAVAMGYQAIRSGDANIVVCGGQESMSQVKYFSSTFSSVQVNRYFFILKCPHCLHLRKGQTMGDVKMIDTMMLDGLTDAFHNVAMGITGKFSQFLK